MAKALTQSMNSSVHSKREREYGRQKLSASLFHLQKCVTTHLLIEKTTHQLLVASASLDHNVLTKELPAKFSSILKTLHDIV